MVKALIWLVHLYQRTLSPDHGFLRVFFPRGICRFQPTCSSYLVESLRRFGLVKGLALGIARVGRCHPYSDGGFDPVPEKK